MINFASLERWGHEDPCIRLGACRRVINGEGSLSGEAHNNCSRGGLLPLLARFAALAIFIVSFGFGTFARVGLWWLLIRLVIAGFAFAGFASLGIAISPAPIASAPAAAAAVPIAAVTPSVAAPTASIATTVTTVATVAAASPTTFQAMCVVCAAQVGCRGVGAAAQTQHEHDAVHAMFLL
jgi:hypothetical protein